MKDISSITCSRESLAALWAAAMEEPMPKLDELNILGTKVNIVAGPPCEIEHVFFAGTDERGRTLVALPGGRLFRCDVDRIDIKSVSEGATVKLVTTADIKLVPHEPKR